MLEVTWKYYTTMRLACNNCSVSAFRLTIKSANESTVGLYSCQAENRLGHVVGNISVVLSGKSQALYTCK